MANKKFIEEQKTLYRNINSVVPKVYASIAIALHRNCGWDYEKINEVFAESQNIWTEYVDLGVDMLKACEEETGIALII